MTWEELMAKLETLLKFVEWEYPHIPTNIKERLRYEKRNTNCNFIVVPISFETKKGQKISAELLLQLGAALLSCAITQKPKKGYTPQYSVYLCSQRPDIQTKVTSYEEFTQILKEAIGLHREESSPFDHDAVKDALVRAYYDLRSAIEGFFRHTSTMCSEDQRQRWTLSRQASYARHQLAKIVQICETSRATVGSSKILGTIREEAQKKGPKDLQYVGPGIYVPVLPPK